MPAPSPAGFGFTKHPATWLNGECWLDEDPPDGGVPLSPDSPACLGSGNGRGGIHPEASVQVAPGRKVYRRINPDEGDIGAL